MKVFDPNTIKASMGTVKYQYDFDKFVEKKDITVKIESIPKDWYVKFKDWLVKQKCYT